MAIPAGAEDAYCLPTVSGQTASMYEHAARAIDHSLSLGSHGLPLMGSGDGNDGMNRVGIDGRGQSVWLVVAQTIQTAVTSTARDGTWFKRAFFDNGQPLGSQGNNQGRIDLIAQA